MTACKDRSHLALPDIDASVALATTNLLDHQVHSYDSRPAAPWSFSKCPGNLAATFDEALDHGAQCPIL